MCWGLRRTGIRKIRRIGPHVDLVEIVHQRLAGNGKTHGAHLADDTVGWVFWIARHIGIESPANAVASLHYHRVQAHAHGFISRDKAGNARPDDQYLAAQGTTGNLPQRRTVAGSLIKEPGVMKGKSGTSAVTSLASKRTAPLVREGIADMLSILGKKRTSTYCFTAKGDNDEFNS